MKRKIFKIIGFIVLIVLAKEIFTLIVINFENYKNVESYYKNESSVNYDDTFVIKIPSINLETVVKKADTNFSNLDKYLVYYKNNDYKNTIIILGHSGLGYGTYFNRLDELTNLDSVYLYIKGYEVEYKLIDKYEIKETQTDILNSNSDNTLVLITCKKNDNTKRIILKLLVNTAKPFKK